MINMIQSAKDQVLELTERAYRAAAAAGERCLRERGVAAYDERTRRGLLRDIYVDIPGHDGNRLNAAYAFGGAELLMKTIEHNFGIPVNRYMLVNFEAFANLVDAVDGIELELKAPVGTKFYQNASEIIFKFSDGDNDHLHKYEIVDAHTLNVTLKDIDEDITFTVGLVADASNAPKVIVKSKDNVLKITDTLTYNDPLNNISLTFKDKNGNPLAANESVTVTKVLLGDKELKKDAAENGWSLTGNTLKLHGTATVTANITIEATLNIKESETITLVAAGGSAKAIDGVAPTKFTISGATVDNDTVKPVGFENEKETYPLTGKSFTFEVPVGKTLKVSLAADSYAYSDDINVSAEKGSFYVITVAAGSS